MMQEIRVLLNRRWILKREDPQMYFKIKDAYGKLQPFLKEKMGYALIINPILAKVEKIPGSIQPWMGITAFENPLSYAFLCWMLAFLEEFEPEEQFVLSQVTDYLKSQPIGEKTVDWTVYSNRKALIRVLQFLKDEGMVLLNDGDDSLFFGSENALEVLYENTGASKYFMRHFPFDLSEVRSVEDFDQKDLQTDEGDRGLARRYRVYRRLALEPIVYQKGGEDADYLYIKNQRGILENDFEKYLEGDIHIHKNGACLLFSESSNIKDVLPNRKNISDITMQTCLEIRKTIEKGEWLTDELDKVTLSRVQWHAFLKKCREQYQQGWSKIYREMGDGKLFDEWTEYMMEFGLIQVLEEEKEIVVLPGAGKFSGDYPLQFQEKRKDYK
ncbi:MAG TPA: TIGR02678 family protein [Eubacteriaceae bacterium]|nr:TIGR02678 family protein [Eubacteriaceae bacterium]